MSCRWLLWCVILASVGGWVGCQPGDSAVLGDAENPSIKTGIACVQSMEFDAAIAAFEQALREQPQSVRAHYELGLLYERHKRDLLSAIYHYNQVLKLKSSGWPADNVRLLMAGCRQELVKAEALGPVARQMQREIDQLRKDNEKLRLELETAKAAAAGPPPAETARRSSATAARSAPSTSTPPRPSPNTPYRPASLPSPTYAATATTATTAGARYHRVQAGETMAAIARRYQVDLSALTAANPHLNPRTLGVGTSVRIPQR